MFKILSTFFYAGYFPLIPGTFATLVGLGLVYLLRGNIFIYTLVMLGVTLLGFAIAGRAEREFHKKDCRCIVIDEIAGILLALWLLPYSKEAVVLGFILFRILDALKPYPADKLQDYPGSVGIMSDDLVAAVYTNIILQAVLRAVSFKIS